MLSASLLITFSLNYFFIYWACNCLLPTTKITLPSTLPFLSFKQLFNVYVTTFPFLTSSFFSLSTLSKVIIKCILEVQTVPTKSPFPCLLMPGIEAIPAEFWSTISLYKNHTDSSPVLSHWCCITASMNLRSAGGCSLKFLPEAAVTFAVTLYQGRGHHPSWELGLFIPELPQSRRWHRLVLATCCCSFQLNFNLS